MSLCAAWPCRFDDGVMARGILNNGAADKGVWRVSADEDSLCVL
jgi:hypothetical protein